VRGAISNDRPYRDLVDGAHFTWTCSRHLVQLGAMNYVTNTSPDSRFFRPLGITSYLPVIREESAALRRASPESDSGRWFCRSRLQIRPAEKIGVARIGTERIEHRVRFYVSDTYDGAILMSFFQPLKCHVLLLKAGIDFRSPHC